MLTRPLAVLALAAAALSLTPAQARELPPASITTRCDLTATATLRRGPDPSVWLVTVTVQNTGTHDSGPFETLVAVEKGLYGPKGLQWGASGNVGAYRLVVPAGQARSVYLQVARNPFWLHRVHVMADVNHEVAETNEQNNEGSILVP